MNKADKIKEVEFVTDSLKASQVAICANYHGLSVSDINDLKKGLRKVGATCRVIKNTLSKISIDKALKEDGKEEESGEVDLVCLLKQNESADRSGVNIQHCGSGRNILRLNDPTSFPN